MTDWISLNCPVNCSGVSFASLNATTNATDAFEYYKIILEETRFLVLRILIPIVVFIGVFGNGLTILVMSRRRMRSSTNTYLTALAVSDLLYLVFVLTLSVQHYPNMHSTKYYFYWLYRPYAIWMVDATTSISIWLTVAFTLERYIAVCHPMRGRLLCTESRARVAIISIYIFCFLVTGTTSFEWETECTCIDGVLHVHLNNSALANDKTYQVVYPRFWSISCVFLPIILIGVFNTFLVMAVYKSTRTRRQMTQRDLSTSTQRMENKITLTLIAVVVMFMVCQIPAAIILIYQSVNPDIVNEPLLLILNNVANFLVVINAAANFILYTVLSGKYRRTLMVLFLRKCYRNRRNSPGGDSGNTTDNSRLTRGTTLMSTVRSTARRSPNFTIREHRNGKPIQTSSFIQK